MKKQWKKIVSSVLLIGSMLIPTITTHAAQMSSAESAVVNIESYEVEEGVLIPGEQVTLNLSLKNNSKTVPAENVVLTLESANYALLPIYGEDNQVYVGTIEAGGTKEVSVKATVNTQYNTDAAQLKIEFSYISGSTPLSNSTAIYIPTYASGNLIAESTVVSGNTTVGARTLVSVKYRNASTANIADIKLVIDGNIAEESKEIALPTASAGKSYMNDYYVTFTESGIQTLTIQYQYTDEQGNKYVTDCGSYKVNVTNEVASDSTATVVQEKSNAASMAVRFVLLTVVGVAVLAVIVIYLRKRR